MRRGGQTEAGVISKADPSPAPHRLTGFALLPFAGAACALALLSLPPNADLTIYVIPWMETVRARGLSSVAAEFSVYTPPYVYLMYLAAGLVPLVGTVAAIKLMCVPFVAAMAVGVGKIVAAATSDPRRGFVAACVLCVAPTVLANAFLWGQSDTIYTCFLTFFVLFAATGRPVAAAVLFGLAVSFKLQAMFLSPLLLYLLISRQMRPWHLALIPLTYVLMMVPAAAAGRPWHELLTIYYGQARYFGELSANAPNPWYFVDALDLVPYRSGAIVGLILGAATGLAIALVALRLPIAPANTLLVAALCSALLPYVLPKMHDRYFFVADVLSLALALVSKRYWPAAILFQLGSLTVYLVLYDLVPNAAVFAFVPISLGLVVLLAGLCEQLANAPPPSRFA